MALIDKELLRKEIERRMNELEADWSGTPAAGWAFSEILSILDTLPEQPVEGLEEEISRTYHDGSVTDTEDIDHVAYENIARHFAEWGKNNLK